MGKPSEEKKTARKPPQEFVEPASLWFVAVAQTDFRDQMDVLYWILEDETYICFYILHDKDVYTAEEISQRAEKDNDGKPLDYITRVNGDGSKSQYREGDLKPPHVHIMVQVRAKMRASTLAKRFCNQLHFEVPQKQFSDKYEACRYLTHECFRARNKHRYERSKVLYSKCRYEESKGAYMELVGSDGSHLLDTVRTFKQCKDAVRNEDDAAHATQRAVSALLDMGDITALKTVMSRAYFFDKML